MTDLLHLAQQVTELILESRHVVAFTGAGVSTESGIPDFRGLRPRTYFPGGREDGNCLQNYLTAHA